MGGTPREEDCRNKVAEARKYLWWQYVGMGIFLATCPGTMMVVMFRVPISPDIFVVLMVTVAEIVFAIGTVGRQELKDNIDVGDTKNDIEDSL